MIEDFGCCAHVSSQQLVAELLVKLLERFLLVFADAAREIAKQPERLT